MFVCSLKTTKKQLLCAAACLALILSVVTASVCFPTADAPAVETAAALADTDEARAAFLRSIGYEAVLPAVSVVEVRLPDSFDDALTSYNELQKQAGFDLSGYAGQRVKFWTYDLREHPSGEAAQAHLYVYQDVVIGGDIASVEADGFLEPLMRSEQASC